jgi:hypothetical protein
MVQNLSERRLQDPILTDIVHGIKNAEYVGMYLFPTVPVSVAGGKVVSFGRESFRKYKTRRALSADRTRLTFGYEGKPYKLVEDSCEVPLDLREIRDTRITPGLSLGEEAVMFGMDVMGLQVEIEQADLATDPNNYDTNNKVALTTGSKLGDSAYNLPKEFKEYKMEVAKQIGRQPNVAIFDLAAYNAATENPNVVDRLKAQGATTTTVTREALSSVIEIPNIYVGESIWFDDEDTSTFVWGEGNVVMAYVPERALSLQGPSRYVPNGMLSRRMPSFGYTYTMDGHPMAEESYGERKSNSEVFPVVYERASVLTALDQGSELIIGGFLVSNGV